MEITAKLIEILPEQTGQGRNGTWIKISFVVETLDSYPRKVCFDAWGDRVDLVKSLNVNDMVKVDFDIESREYNGRWYTNAKAWRIEKQGEEQQQDSYSNAAAATNPPLPDIEAPAAEDSNEITDDLPF